MRIVDREPELASLAEAALRARGQLALVWGRRRVGKTFLLQAFSQSRRTVSYTATQQSAPVELAAFTEAVRTVLGSDGLPSGYAFPDWSAALDFGDSRCRTSTAHCHSQRVSLPFAIVARNRERRRVSASGMKEATNLFAILGEAIVERDRSTRFFDVVVNVPRPQKLRCFRSSLKP